MRLMRALHTHFLVLSGAMKLAPLRLACGAIQRPISLPPSEIRTEFELLTGAWPHSCYSVSLRANIRAGLRRNGSPGCWVAVRPNGRSEVQLLTIRDRDGALREITYPTAQLLQTANRGGKLIRMSADEVVDGDRRSTGQWPQWCCSR